MRKILNLFIILVTLLLVGCNNEELPIENVYSINGPSILQVETYDKTVNEIKNEIESNFNIIDQNNNIINIYHIIVAYDDIDFYITHTYDVVISSNIINNNLEKIFKLIIVYNEDEEKEFNINIILDINESKHDQLTTSNELLNPLLPLNPQHPKNPNQFIFKYWAFDEDGKNEVPSQFLIDNDYQIFAIWENLYPHTLKITLEETDQYNIVHQVENNAEIYSFLPNNPRHPIYPNDYEFSYWAFDEAGLEPLPDYFPVDDSYYIYAIWQEKNYDAKSIDIFYINDLHGQLFENDKSIGLSRIHQFIQDYNQTYNTESIIIFGGDIFQGTLISRNSYGEVLIDAMNLMGVDALVLGNHEFDWEIDMITRYFDPNYSGVTANFPLLSANTFIKGTNDLLPYTDPYTVINRNGLDVGIIGLMGYELESSIMETKVDQYYFAEPVNITGTTAQAIRSQHNTDLIISAIHGDGSGDVDSQPYNGYVSNLSGEKLIDAVFNAHTHRRYDKTLYRAHAYNLPVMQSGANGNTLGHLKLTVENKKVIAHSINQYYPNSSVFSSSNDEMDLLLDSYYQDVRSNYEDILITSTSNLSKDQLSSYMTRIMRERTNSDIAIHNNGGTRTELSKGDLTHADIFQVFPFDNKVVKVRLLGQDIKRYITRFGGGSTFNYRDGLNKDNLNNNTYYDVAVNEYIFAFSDNPFVHSNNIEFFEEQDLLMKLTWERLNDLGITNLNLNHQNVWLNTNNITQFYFNERYYNQIY